MATGEGTKQAMEPENRTISGAGNNLTHPEWGSAGQQLLRLTPAAYADGAAAPAGAFRANPRAISNAVCAQGTPEPSPQGLSNFIWAWGQFLDHELDLTGPARPTESLNMTAPPTDPKLPNGIIEFTRSVYDAATGGSPAQPRQQLNLITSFVDASNVYGSDDNRANALRANDGTGRLRSFVKDVGELLPKNLYGAPNAAVPPLPATAFFLAGDVRANEHSVLTSLHTVFVRKHNRLCGEIAKKEPQSKGDDEVIYQRARRIVGALMQAVAYNEFLPALLGAGAITPYPGYNPAARPDISNVFSTACYRVGHTMIPDGIPLSLGEQAMPLRDGYFQPALIDERGIEPFLEGLALSPMQKIDTHVVEGLRTLLFRQFSEKTGRLLDLAALNIQRGRDHGLADYNACREAFGLTRNASFAEITSDAGLQAELQQIYFNVDNIDAWIGGLAEDHVSGAAVGELIFTVLKDQFERTRDGDRFWYENDPAFSPKERSEIASTTLAEVIERNTTIENLPANVFVVPT